MDSGSSICQSCAMPLMNPDDYGTEKDRSKSDIYCKYCYQKGEFINKDACVESISELGARMMHQMYQMPLDKARIFMSGQIRTLKRWSGKIIPSCQSCGMPLFTPEDTGTEQDGKPSTTYCKHCYQNGSFTEPSLTHEEMIQKCSPFLTEQFGVPKEKAVEMARTFTSTLSRWK